MKRFGLRKEERESERGSETQREWKHSERERDREKIEEVQIDRERCIERKEGIQRQVKKHR